MKTLAAIKNELFKDYLKIVSTDNLEQTLDNPAVPVPFVCVASVENNNAEALAVEINKFFNHKKIKNKDFLAVDEDDIAQLNFLFNLISVSGGNPSVATQPAIEVKSKVKEEVKSNVAPAESKVEQVKAIVEEVKAEIKVEAVVEPVIETEVSVVDEKVVPQEAVEVEDFANTVDELESSTPVVTESFADTIEELEEASPAVDSNVIIESLGIPVNSGISFIKKPEITAILIDEKTISLDGETLSIVDGTKKAFKKAGVTGMALGLANWNFEGNSLKSLKDKN
jgi:hypothetical protein